MKKPLVALVAFCLGGLVLAQTSASFKLEEHTFNAGGNPDGGVILTSASFQISRDAIGDAVAATGLTSASFQLDTGFPTGYPPPGEVNNLLFTDATTLVWDAEGSIGSYNLYRDLLSNLSGLGYGGCEEEDLTDETTTDNDAAPAGDGYFYLVTSENKLTEEGTKGFNSTPTERTGTACP